jgi:hypothetical protein
MQEEAMPEAIQSVNADKESTIRSRWWREEDLVNQRLTWLFASHGLLAVGYAWLRYRIADIRYNPDDFSDGPVDATAYIRELQDLMNILAGVGAGVAFFVLCGLMAAWYAQRLIWARNPELDLGASIGTTNTGRIVALCVPMACLFVWAYATFEQSKPMLALSLFSATALFCFAAAISIERPSHAMGLGYPRAQRR